MTVKEFIKKFYNDIQFKESILSKTTEFQQRRNFKEYKGFKDIYMGSALQEINEKVKPIKTPLPNRFNQ